ncbi:MAG: hypothetical protein FWD61_03835 [Phycisphaerales bacterium]|nr:hypothetical protein [Phycisphaerales bacterium]
MKNVVMLCVEVSSEYQPLSKQSLVASVDINVSPRNAGPVFFRGTDGKDVPWDSLAGQWHRFSRIDLSEIFVKGTPGDVVTVVGGT